MKPKRTATLDVWLKHRPQITFGDNGWRWHLWPDKADALITAPGNRFYSRRDSARRAGLRVARQLGLTVEEK
jgi:hypothetical protein